VNEQDYISSGLLEAYVLGGLSLTESEQVAGAMCRFPAVAEEIARLEADIFKAAETDSVNPPPGLDDKIWAAIQSSGAVQGAASNPAFVNSDIAQADRSAHRVIALVDNSPRRQQFSWALAAALVVLVGSAAVNFMQWNNGRAQREELASLHGRMDEMDVHQRQLTANLDRYKHEAEMMAQPGMMPVPMRSMQPGHPMAATIYWDKTKGEAYVSVQKLPPPPEGMQYQLWAIAGGKPVDIGMLDNQVVVDGGMQRVPKAVMASEAFAVSLEKAGGNPTPTADKIYLMGKMPV
jgi:anti-sigma-K factor RskA